MTRAAQKVIYGKGAQIIYHLPMNRDGSIQRVPSGATYGIIDLRWGDSSAEHAVVAHGTSAGLSSVNTTTTATAGPAAADAKRVQLTSALSVVVGRTYLIQNSTGQCEAFTVATLSGTDAYTLTPLRRTYASGSAVLGLELEATFPALEANDEDEVESGGGRYLVVWDYEIAGEKYKVMQEHWLTRYSVQPFITSLDVLRVVPTFSSRTGERMPIGLAIAAAHEDFLSELERAQIGPADIAYFIVQVTARKAVRDRAIAYIYRALGTQTDLDQAKEYDARWSHSMVSLLSQDTKLANKTNDGEDRKDPGFLVEG